MSDLERRLRQTMRQQLEPVDVFPLAPQQLRRAKTIRIVTAALAGLLTVSLVAAALVAAPRLFGNEGRNNQVPGEMKRGPLEVGTLGFQPSEGWNTASTATIDTFVNPTVWAWTADLEVDFPEFPTHLLPTMEDTDAFIAIELPFRERLPAEPNQEFPAGELPLSLDDATVHRSWEGQPHDDVIQYRILRTIDGVYVDARIYFASSNPSQETLARAQQQLQRLQLPMVHKVPSVAVVRCTEDGTRVDSSVVRPMPDGVHIRFVNETDDRGFHLRSVDDAAQNEGGRLRPNDVTELTTSAPPGETLIGCFESPSDPPFFDTEGQDYARLTIVDPEGLWVNPELACGRGWKRSRIRTDVKEQVDPEQVAHDEVPGLRDGDVIRRPGYPGTEWHLDTHVVVRDGENVAFLVFGRRGGRWEIGIHACPGSAIGKAS